jgi:hypothetical protein
MIIIIKKSILCVSPPLREIKENIIYNINKTKIQIEF